MLTVVIRVDAPGWTAQGVKECLAMQAERFGDTVVVEVRSDENPVPCDGQLTMEEGG